MVYNNGKTRELGSDYRMEIAVAIPTYNRPDDLRLCVRAVARQSLVPERVLVIDDGRLDQSLIDELEMELRDAGSRLVYIRKDHRRIARGLSESRNIALHAVDEPVLMIDDDIVLDPDCLFHMVRAWEISDDGRLIGVGGVIGNGRRKSVFENLFNRIFSLSSPLHWDVNEVGYQVWSDTLRRRETGHYAHGGFCMYSPRLARKIPFASFQGGRPGLEDVHFALRAKIMGYRFVIEPKATCEHRHSAAARDGMFELGFRESVNRRVIFRDLCGQGLGNRVRFGLASAGWIARQLLAGNFSKGFGMIAGMLARKALPQAV